MVSQYNQSLSPEIAHSLEMLKQGNKRFTSGLKSLNSMVTISRLKELAQNGQKPSTVILACADSRVPVETLFDCGAGELFVLRVAGNVVSPDLVASIEYAAAHLSTHLCVVMGHTSCGAVNAAIQHAQSEASVTENTEILLNKIVPAVMESKKVLDQCVPDSLTLLSNLNNISMNARSVIETSKLIQSLVSSRKFHVTGALFDLHTGQVNFDLNALRHSLKKSREETVRAG